MSSNLISIDELNDIIEAFEKAIVLSMKAITY